MNSIKSNQYHNQLEDPSSLSRDRQGNGRFKMIFLYVKSFLPFFLSHHPECKYFKGHTINCGKIRLCIGCFIGYPTAFLTVFLVAMLDTNNFFSSDFFFILSLIFLGTFFLSLLNLTKRKIVKIIQKFLIGVGAALLYNWIMKRPYPRNINLKTVFIIFYPLLIILNLYHAYGILGSCYKCETPFNWGICSGFKNIRERMKNYNVENFLLKFEELSVKLQEKRAK